MNKDLAKFCGVPHYKVERFCECGDLWCPDGQQNKDFTTPDGYALLHAAMGEKGLWLNLYLWLHRRKSVSGTSPACRGNHFHQLPFREQAELIHNFIVEQKG